MKKLIAALLLLSLPGTVLRAEGRGGNIDDLRGLVLNHAKIPVFNRSRLQMMLFSGRAERRGEIMVGFDTVLEIIRSGADADAINDGWGLKPYPLYSPLRTVFDFWKGRMSYSDGVMCTPECEIDQHNRRAGGNGEVFFRSPLLDLDGVGFEADFTRRTIAVNSQVKIVIRQSSADPAEIVKAGGKLPFKYEYITASGDSMLIDSARREVMLIGNVRVDEDRAFLTCDRLTVFWDGENGDGGNKTAETAGFGGSGVSRILADGEVVITKKDNASEQAFADHMVCDVPNGTVKLTGDEVFPKLISAKGEVLSGRDILFERATRRGLITGGCRIEGAPELGPDGKKIFRQVLTSATGFFDAENNVSDFTGNVKMLDGDRTVECDKMRLVTGDRAGGKTTAAPAAEAGSGTGSLLGTDSLGGLGGKELKNAEFYGNVVLRDASRAKLVCERMLTDFAATGKDGKLELSNAKCFKNVKVENFGSAPGELPGFITADRSELDYLGDKLTFEGNVKGRRENSTLDCDKLDFHLGKKQTPGTGGAVGAAAIGAGDSKTLKKAVATGKVHVTDSSGKLDCDRLSLFFSELPPGAKPEPGMFQSGGVRLTDIVADGRVVAVNQNSAKAEKEQPGLFSGKSSGDRVLKSDHGHIDLARNISHFTGNVDVSDRESRIVCDEMFIYGANSRPEPQIPGLRAPAEPEDPDADPFALPGFTEDTVPSTVNVTENVKLKRVLCLGDVRLTRIDPDSKRKQEGGGGRCEYLTEQQVAVLTDTPPRRPWLRAEGRQQYAERIVYDLKDGIFRSYQTDTFTVSGRGSAPK